MIRQAFLCNWMVLLSAVTLLSGCGRKGGSSAELSVGASATNVQSAFQGASEEVRQTANAVASAVQASDSVTAYVQVENLSNKPELTSEQRQAVFDMQMALLRQLQADAAKGNAAAEELLNKYRSTK